MVSVTSFDPLAPNATPSSSKHTFKTLERERANRHPSVQGMDHPALEELVMPHIESFNALMEDLDDVASAGKGRGKGLLQLGVEDLEPKVIFDGKNGGNEASLGNKITYQITHVALGRPMVPDKDRSALDRRVYPTESRERLTTYKSKLTVRVRWTVQTTEGETSTFEEARECGQLPIMIKSNRCNLKGLSSAALVGKHEESSSWGGYFIVNGNEKIIRYLILPRRHHAISLIRPSFEKRGPTYSKFGVQIRCVRKDETACTNTVHYLTSGGATLRFAWRKNEFMIPLVLILKALTDASDKEIFEGLVQGENDNTFLTDRVELLLRSAKVWKLYSGAQCLEYLGQKFRVVLGCPEDWSNLQVGNWLLNRVVLVHLTNPREKFRMLL